MTSPYPPWMCPSSAVLNLLQDLQEEKGLTYIFVTHDLSVVKHISDDIMVMYVGCTVEKCAAEELFQAPLHPYTKGLLSAIPVPNIHRERKRIVMQGELTTPIDPAPGCRFANRCPYAKERCQNEMPCYEEVLPRAFCGLPLCAGGQRTGWCSPCVKLFVWSPWLPPC